ncbi:MAG: hypothetical protein J0H19_19415 [Rhodospirillales bacterium]|nr:hypothetical protein [Rhodospirillales bacterium]MBN8928785.1 hypothetical protein [Rhodospirillales bacterium]
MHPVPDLPWPQDLFAPRAHVAAAPAPLRHAAPQEDHLVGRLPALWTSLPQPGQSKLQ